jgi:hypothetical protein
MEILLGTRKGLFTATRSQRSGDWHVEAPTLDGWEVSTASVLNDGSVTVGTTHFVYGATLRTSEDLKTWAESERSPRFPPERTAKLNRFWCITQSRHDSARLFVGVDEAALFVSDDNGANWRENNGLSDHPTRHLWAPGFGGMCLHSIVEHPTDPNRIWVAASAIGAFRSDDGGASWHLKVDGIPAVPTGQEPSPVGRCVHRLVISPSNPEHLFIQYHGGVFRSRNSGDSWERIEAGLPSNFGFPILINEHGRLFVIPLVSDMNRVTVGGQLRVYASDNEGDSWDAIGDLPSEPTYTGVLRDAADTVGDAVAFGTTTGDAYVSLDNGEHWGRIPGRFPRISSVRLRR